MAALSHVYLTAHGGYAAGHWAGETAQMGLRLAIHDLSNRPDKGTTFTIATNNGDVVPASGTTAGTNGSLANTWTARLGAVGSTDNADGAWQADLADDFWTFLNAIKFAQHNQFAWTHVKIAPILATGAYGAPSAIYTFTSPLAGTATAAQPPEVALAITFRAAIVGRTGRGRVYVPALGSSTTVMDTDGTASPTLQSSFLTATNTLVTNLQNPPGTPTFGPTLMVTSAGKTTGVRPSQIRCGEHFDAQRRRQHQVKEAYSEQAL